MNKKRQYRLALVCAMGMSHGIVAQGNDFSTGEFANKNGMFEAFVGSDLNDNQFSKDTGINFGGWMSFGLTYNAEDPGDNNNTPVTFNDRDLELQGNQLNLFIERAVDAEGDSWDIGGRVDMMYGTDGRFTSATGLDDDIITDGASRFYKLVFPQLYAQVFAPIGNGVTATVGHFYTIIGNEVVTSPDNFFYSHAYTMQYGEPFTHTGVLLETPLTGNINLKAGGVLGWDNFSEDTDIWNFLGGIDWTSDDEATSIAIAAVYGDVSEDRPNDDRWVYSVVASHNFSDNLHYTIQHDHGREEGVVPGTDAKWYGINQYLAYDLSETLAAGVRAEWFSDVDGTRVQGLTTGAGTDYYAVTLGLNAKVANWITVRPEIRYDWSHGGADPYDVGTSNHQLLIATDVVITF